MLRYAKNALYSACLSGAVLLAGCTATNPAGGLQQISAKQSPIEALVEKISAPEQELVNSHPTEENVTKKPVYRASAPSTGYQLIEISHVEMEEADTLDYRAIPKATEDKPVLDLDRTIRLDLDLSQVRYVSTQRGLDIDLVTYRSSPSFWEGPTYRFNNQVEYSRSQVRTQQYFNDDPWNHEDDFYYRSDNFGARELKVVLYAVREIIRGLGQEFAPFYELDLFLRRVEKLGKKLRDIEEGIQEIWTLDLGNLVEDITDPFGPLKKAVGAGSSEYQEPSVRRRSKAFEIDGRLEPTLNGHTFGARAGQDLIAIISGQERADLGLQLSFEMRF